MLIALAFVAALSSQPPAPSATKSGNENQQVSAAHQQHSEPETKAQVPAVFSVKMLNPPNTNAIAEQLKEDRDERAANEGRNWIFSILLVFVGIVQGGVLLYTALVSSKAARGAIVAADAAQKSADALPRVEQAYVFLDRTITCGINWPEVATESRKSTLYYQVINYGKTPAILRELHLGMSLDGIPTEEKFRSAGGGEVPLSIVLASGQKSELPGYEFTIDGASTHDLVCGKRAMVFYGWLIYEDVFGGRNELGFCRQYWKKSKLFDYAVTERLNYQKRLDAKPQ